jgi:hypothetical protein
MIFKSRVHKLYLYYAAVLCVTVGEFLSFCNFLVLYHNGVPHVESPTKDGWKPNQSKLNYIQVN